MKSTTGLTFYGGVNEIGGNQILLQDRDTRVFFDFGRSFVQKSSSIRSVSFAKKRAQSARAGNSSQN